jgi:hypothetical protein
LVASGKESSSRASDDITPLDVVDDDKNASQPEEPLAVTHFSESCNQS